MTNQKSFTESYFFSVMLAIISVAFVYFSFGIFWEESMKYPPSVIYACISPPPLEAWFNEAMLFQVPVLGYLSAFFHHLPVLGIWFLFLQILWLSLWFYLSIRIFSRVFSNSKTTSLLFACGIVLCISGTSIFYIHVNRISILLIAASILLLIDNHFYGRPKQTILYFAFLLGCLTRLTSGVLVLVLLTFFLFLLVRNIQKVFKLLWFHWATILLLISIVVVNKYTTSNPALIIEQTYEYALMDRHDVKPISEMKTKNDSVKYQALTTLFLITDSSQITLDFIDKVVDSKSLLNNGITIGDIRHLENTLLPILIQYRVVLFCIYGLIVLLLIGCSTNVLFSVVILNLFGWLFLIGLSLKISMYERFLEPWIGLLFIASLIIIFLHSTKVHNLKKAGALLLLLVMLYSYYDKVKQDSVQEKEYNRNADKYLQNLKALTATSTPIIWDYNQLLFPTNVLERDKLKVLKKCIYQTMFFISYYKFGQERCLEQFGFSPLNWRAMGMSFKKNRNKVCFVMEDGVANFLQEYYKTIYNIDFILVKDFPPNEITPNNFVYHLQTN